jgi:hypothetical protein
MPYAPDSHIIYTSARTQPARWSISACVGNRKSVNLREGNREPSSLGHAAFSRNRVCHRYPKYARTELSATVLN